MRSFRFRLAGHVFLRFHGDSLCRCGCFGLKASKFFAGFAPAGAEALFFAPPKKSTQKKGGPKAQPAGAGSLRFSRKPAHAQLAISLRSKAQTSACFIRFSLRCSAAPTGGVDLRPFRESLNPVSQHGSTVNMWVLTYPPVALTEYRSQSGE